MTTYDLLISGGEVVLEEVLPRDLLVKDGKVARICRPEESVTYQVKETLDASGKLIFPGAIDSHVHFNDPGFEWREDFLHGTKAAAKGGITTVIDMPLQNTPALATAELFAMKAQKIAGSAYTDYGFWGALLSDNREALPALHQAGVFAFKSFIAPVGDDYDSLSYGEVRDRLLLLKEFDALSGYHCEDYSLISCLEQAHLASGAVARADYLASRPVTAEAIAVDAVIRLAEETGTRVHIVHVSHPDVAEIIKQAKARGVRVTAETCVHYLVFSNEDLIAQGPLFKCAPPLRDKAAAEKLWSYLLDGTLDLIVSDHSPSQMAEKAEDQSRGIFAPWGGISGVQSTVQVMFSEWQKRKLPWPQLAALLAANAAEIFQIPGKGKIAVGNDADFVLIDPQAEWQITAEELAYKNKISAFVGYQGTGLPTQTILRGQVVYDNHFPAAASGQLLQYR